MCALNFGIVGLPNVGKSNLFNILLRRQEAESANYPFCTIEPTKALVAVIDKRLQELARLAGSKEIIYPQIGITDIAGLVAGASKGEGLGNQFLANIRETDGIIHVLRFFEDNDIIHVNSKVDPIYDKEIIETELMIADMESLAKRTPNLERKARSDPEAKKELELSNMLSCMLQKGEIPHHLKLSEEEMNVVRRLQLLTTKPMIYLCNVSEESFLDGKYMQTEAYKHLVKLVGLENIVVMPVRLESDFIGMDDEERSEYMQECGIEPGSINNLIKKCYEVLNLHSFFTIGPKEAHAWEILLGTNAKKAAATIHSDIEHGFIRAEVISYNDYITCGSESGARSVGKLRSEGKDYIVQDGDIINFLHSN